MEKFGYHLTDFHEILYLNIFQNLLVKIQVSLNYDKNNGYFHEDISTFSIISIRIIIRNMKFLDQTYRDNKKNYFCKYVFFKNHVVYEVM
jgi:hypothetical protein